MIMEFSVENFLSFKERVTLSMVASKDRTLIENLIQPKNYANIFKNSLVSKESLLKTGVIYGSNASGKTNFIHALNFMREYIVEGHKIQKGDTIPVIPFKLDKKSELRPSLFEIFFVANGVKYVYGFKIDQKEVHEEYLYFYPKGRQKLIFERLLINGKYKYKFNQDKEEQETLSKRTLENRLYLSTATEWNYEPMAVPFKWFKEKLQIFLNDSFNADLTLKRSKDQKFKHIINKFLSEADLGILDFDINYHNFSEDNLPENMPKEIIFKGIQQYQQKDDKLGKIQFKVTTSDDIKLYHKGVDLEGNQVKIPLSLTEESAGTNKIFNLVGNWIDALINGKVLIIDELETSLHSNIIRFLIKLFHGNHNIGNAQLIFTTHSTNLLRRDIFRRDQIWFTEKSYQLQSSSLYSLLEIKTRKDENYEKGYLEGRYGAVPYIGEGLLWDEDFIETLKVNEVENKTPENV
ncbi:AAA family ATPase [Tepidibacillus decaturensis]|uniref:ATPase AAA-type core domain-containing protein n=1 Tax=Tepidibacillus decaturensis TaxID=1413211 RepID=A0A135L6I9_9BACI|nr:ATP-binding protein [Tepidibacillus decaturensis]KXG44580.1 hypothetical protein U473_11545 [Tepidibacillus decaturensis]